MAVKIIVRFICAGCGKVEELTSAKVNSWGYFWHLKDEEKVHHYCPDCSARRKVGVGPQSEWRVEEWGRREGELKYKEVNMKEHEGGGIPCRTC